MTQKMGIRVRPEEIEIPSDDPFRNDLLNRKEPAQILTQLIDGIDGPCVLAVDAAWGAGKTTFLKMWAQHLRNERVPVVEFNAWETDHAGDPFVAIVTELTEGLRGFEDESLTQKIGATKEAAKQVALRAMPGLIRVATAGVLDLQPLMEKELGRLLASYAEDRLKQYTGEKASIEEFRTKLQEVAESLALSECRPLIVMIDELDRCRPSYAVELLEITKHLFDIDQAIFVLAVNRDQLTHSIKALYGNDFDATGYLRRFIDLDFRLPKPDKPNFLVAALNAARVHGDVCLLLQAFFTRSNVSLRQAAQAARRLAIISTWLGRHPHSALLTGVAIILRTIDANLYEQFTLGAASDESVVDSAYTLLGIARAERESRSQRHIFSGFEAIIAIAAQEIAGETEVSSADSVDSSLIRRHREVLSGGGSSDLVQPPTERYSRRVIEQFDDLVRNLDSYSYFGFLDCVRRIEMFDRR